MRHWIIAAFLVVSFQTYGQKKDTLSSRLQTPYLALKTFVDHVADYNYQPRAASILFNNPTMTMDQKLVYVKLLEQVLEGAGIFIFFEEVPTDPNYLDSLTQQHRYVIHPSYPEIYLEKKRDRWQIQPDVMNSLEAVHSELFKFDPKTLIGIEIDKTGLNVPFLGLRLWQWLGIVVLVMICLMIRYIFTLIFGRLLVRFLDEMGHHNIGQKLILPVSRPTGMLMVLFFVLALYPSLELPQLVGYYVILTLKGLIPFYGIIILYRMVDILDIFLMRLAGKTTSTLDDQLVPLVRKILRVSIVLIGGLVILDSLEVPILPLLTGLSIGGLAFALAAQDTIKNFFGSLMIFIDKPFQIGDWIVTGDIDGTVEEVGFRSTRVRTFRNSVVYVPNGKLADSTIDNNGLRQMRRFRTMIQIKYDTPPSLVESFVEGLIQVVLRHPQTSKEKYEIHFNELGSHSLDILFYIFFEVPTWSDELKFRQEILLEILRLAEHMGVEFAYPTQTLHVENLPGQKSLSQTYVKEKDQLKQKLDQFFGE